jgi:hypothetical protein
VAEELPHRKRLVLSRGGQLAPHDQMGTLRRSLSVNWFRPIVRVGSTGLDEQPLTFTPKSGPKTSVEATFKARSSGEVFLFVNDSVLVLPRFSQFFYDNNKGTAEVKIELVP